MRNNSTYICETDFPLSILLTFLRPPPSTWLSRSVCVCNWAIFNWKKGKSTQTHSPTDVCKHFKPSWKRETKYETNFQRRPNIKQKVNIEITWNVRKSAYCIHAKWLRFVWGFLNVRCVAYANDFQLQFLNWNIWLLWFKKINHWF